MIVSDIVKGYELHDAKYWSGEFGGIINKLGFAIKSCRSGYYDNYSDGQHHALYNVVLNGNRYTIEVMSNWYCNEEEKLRDILKSDIEARD